MADLSSLLNPAPSSEPSTQQNHVAHGAINNHGARAPTLPPVKIGAPEVQASIKSPLDTLADAATSSAPMLSPTNLNSTSFMSLGNYNRSNAQSSSRPSSSHFSPPQSLDHSHAPVPTSPTFSPGLQQYHHPTSSEVRLRRPSETTETLAEALPPLRRPLPDSTSIGPDESSQHLHTVGSVSSILPGIDAAAASIQNETLQNDTETKPMTSQIRQPSPRSSIPAQESNLPSIPLEQAQVKNEMADATPDLTSPSTQPLAQMPDSSDQPKQEIENMTPAADMKSAHSPEPASIPTPEALLKPQPAPSRKRPPPKKGTATTVKPAAKKRKVDKSSEGTESTSLLARSGTPSSSRASKTPAPKPRKQQSATPQRSSSIANDDSDDEGGVFCICRGPDDHTWMIACDGPCEDWFHGRCINMTEKESQLIEKYYCPNCTEAGKGETLWKRMCRLEGCRRPARVNGANGAKRSKYCSDEHGCEFMKRLALQMSPEDRKAGIENLPISSTPKKGRTTNNSFANVDLSNETDTQLPETKSSEQPTTKDEGDLEGKESQSHLRGGVLAAGELKALVTGVKNISDFRRLGDGGVLSPPPTAKPNNSSDVKMEDAPPPFFEPGNNKAYQIPYTSTENEHLQTLTKKKDDLRARKKFLDDRDIFLTLVRERAKGVLDELKKKENVKDICGFDARLVWLDDEFESWRTSPEGIKALQGRKLGPPPAAPQQQHVNGEEQRSRPPTSNGDAVVPPAVSVVNGGEQDPAAAEELGRGVCRKKKCERHRYWYKLQQQEIAFAKDEVRQGMRKLDEEEKGVRDRARVRWLEEGD